MYSGIRHGILSCYKLKKNSNERINGAKNKAKEVVTAALFSRRELWDRALQGEIVPLQLASTSLVTATDMRIFGEEAQMLREQMVAWEELSQQDLTILQIRNKDGELQQVKVKLEVAAFNFGINEVALKLPIGNKQSDVYNQKALRQLFGDNFLRPTDVRRGNVKPKGWVGEYLKQYHDNNKIVMHLSEELRDIWLNKLHHRDGGEPCKAPARIGRIAYEIGAVHCYNCKSGKDRTGMLDVEIKDDAAEWLRNPNKRIKNVPGTVYQHDKSLMQKMLLNSGNLEIQTHNTGVPGNKVLKKLLSFLIKRLSSIINLSYEQRIGSTSVREKAQGYSGLYRS